MLGLAAKFITGFRSTRSKRLLPITSFYSANDPLLCSQSHQAKRVQFPLEPHNLGVVTRGHRSISSSLFLLTLLLKQVASPLLPLQFGPELLGYWVSHNNGSAIAEFYDHGVCTAVKKLPIITCKKCLLGLAVEIHFARILMRIEFKCQSGIGISSVFH